MAAYFVREQTAVYPQRRRQPEKSGADPNRRFINVTHDPLLANLRYTLRKRHGFSRYQTKNEHTCVFSTENITPPQLAEACETDAAPQGLSCAGYGASMLVTASFGLYCAQTAIDHIGAKA